MSMPDPTLGRVQNEGFSNAMQALQAMQNNITQGTHQQMQVIQGWQERDFKRKEAEKERQFMKEHELEKLKKVHDYDMIKQKDQQAHTASENKLERSTRERMNAANNATQLDISNRDLHHMAALTGGKMYLRDKKGNIIYGPARTPMMKDNYLGITPQQNAPQAQNTQETPTQKH